MVQIIGVIILSLIIIYLEIPSLIKNKAFRELSIFLTLLLAANVISAIHLLDITIPNPMDTIATIYKPLNDFFSKLLE